MSAHDHSQAGAAAQSSASTPRVPSLSSPPSTDAPGPGSSLRKRSRSSSTEAPTIIPSSQPSTSTLVSKPKIIPILPTPLPSKRFKKGSHARALLVPVEQLPVFALPPLPLISDPGLEKQVFCHQSMFPRRKWRFEDPEEDPSGDYEKLEHVGDSILGMVVTTWLHELKPHLTCGTASVSQLILPF